MMIQKSLTEMIEAPIMNRTKAQKGNFQKMMMEAVDRVFSSKGDSCKQFLYFHLQNSYNIGKQEIPYRIDDFAEALKAIFGLGAVLIEIEIMKELFSRVQISTPRVTHLQKQEDLSFTTYVKQLCSL
jgi:nucleoside-diphosphate-sugar epimerase